MGPPARATMWEKLGQAIDIAAESPWDGEIAKEATVRKNGG